MLPTARCLRLWMLLALATPAWGAPVAGRVLLEDGARTVMIERLAEPGRQGASVPVRLSHPASGRATDGRLGRGTLVRIAPQVDVEGLLARLGARLSRAVMPSLGLWLIEDLGAADGLTLAARLQHSEAWGRELSGAFPDLQLPHRLAGLDAPPNDPRYPGQWFLTRIGIEKAWRIESGQPEVGVVVIDSGCDLGHQDLKDKLDPGLDVVDDDNDPSPVAGEAHGTSCAGLVAASTNNGEGVAGACPGCRMRCVRLLAGNMQVPLSADIEAFDFVLSSDAAVTSNSWGFRDPIPVPEMLRAAIEQVHDKGRGGKGALVVFAAGNDNRPLADDELNAVRGVITVGAVNNFGELTQYSNSGPSVDLVAPTGTLTTDIRGAAGEDPGDYTAKFGGTSSACPLVAGVAGLLVSLAPDRTADEIEAAMVETAKQSSFATPNANGHDLFYGFGEIDPAAALERFAPPPVTPPMSGCGCQLGAAPARTVRGVLLLVLCAAVLTLRRRALRRPA